MDRPLLIKCYFDRYAGLRNVDNEAIVVSDTQSYAAARQAIEKMKAGERPAPLTLIVRSRHFYTGFHDLNLLGDLVQTKYIAPRETIANAFHIQIPDDLTDQDLLTLGIESDADLVAVADPQEIRNQTSFESTLLKKAFGSEVFQINNVSNFESWFIDLVAFLYSEETTTKAGWTVEYVRGIAEEKIGEVLERFEKRKLLPFVVDILRRSIDGETHAYLSQLAVRYWLNNYPKLARKAVVDNMTARIGQWEEVKSEAAVFDVLAPWCEALYAQIKNPLIDQLEQVLTLLLEKEDLIEDKDLNRYIQQTSGRFMAEYNAAEARLEKLILEQHNFDPSRKQRAELSAHFAQLDSHFTPLFDRTGHRAKKASWFDSLPEFSEIMSHLDETTPSHWADWLAIYELLIKAKHLKRELQETVPGQYAEQLAELDASFSTLDEKLNSQFGDWLLEEYPKLVTSSSRSQPSLVMNVARWALDNVDQGNKVILLVIDGLDWELWQHLRSTFGEKGFVVQGHEAGLAMLPSITEFSRRAIFGGISPRSLASFVDDIYDTDIRPREEASTLARALGYLGQVDQLKPMPINKRIRHLGGELVYVNGDENDFRQALSLDAKCYAFVYTEIDSQIHVSKLDESKFKASARQWLSSLVEEIVQAIQQNPSLRDETNLKFIVTSDHGFLNVRDKGQTKFEKSLSVFLDLERHGRLAIVRTKDEDMTLALRTVKEFHSRHSAAWHIIWREQSEQFGLPESSSSEGEVIAWLMPRLLQYVRRGRGNYVHGGLSLYEMVVPSATLSKGELELEAPVVTLTGRLTSEEESALSITVLNKNSQPVQNLTVDIPEMGLERLRMGNVGPLEIGNLVVSLIPPKSGDIAVQVIINGDIGGVRTCFEETRVLTVQPGRRERVRLSTRRTFDDEDDW